MSLSNFTPTNRTYMSGTYLVRFPYIFPDCLHDPWWISQWKFNDISSGSGNDSKGSGPCSNTLKSSGTLTQVAGNRQASGVSFDGTSACFYLNWNQGSGLGPGISQPQLRGATSSTIWPHFGFICSMKISDFSHDQIIASKWNDVGSDREWYVGINTSGGIYYAYKVNGGSTLEYVNSPSGSWVPSGVWFDFMFSVGSAHGNAADNGHCVSYAINDIVFTECISTQRWDNVGASGVFCIGAANYGLNPSGFFTGSMEDFRWYNGESPVTTNYNAYRSGVAPLTSYPALNDINPYIGGHYQLNTWQSGAHGVTGIKDTFYAIERKNSQHLAASGTNAFKQYATAGDCLAPGAADGSRGSGTYGFSTGAFLTRPNRLITPDTIQPRGSFTIMLWARHNANTLDAIIGTSAGLYNWSYNTNAAAFNIAKERTAIGSPFRAAFGASWTSAQAALVSGMWTHVVHVIDLAQNTVDVYVSGTMQSTVKLITVSGLNNYDNWNNFTGADYRLGYLAGATVPYSGLLQEIILFNYAVPSGQITNFYQQQSGFLPITISSSGSVGGYATGSNQLITTASGMIGGYIVTGIGQSGSIGGWISGVPFYQSGMLGAYIRVGPTASGNIAGYIWGLGPSSGMLGGYVASSVVASGYIGGYTRGVENVDQANSFVAFFNIIGRTRKEFDAQAKIALSQIKAFDARAIVYIEEKPPLVNIFIPSVDQSGNFAPVTYNFEAHASGQQGKSIYKTFWFFPDTTSTSGSILTSSGTYQTSHTFTKSGIFDVVFIAVDSNGLVSSDRRIINTASGYPLPQISLTASPESGVAPLSVGFSGIINSAPAEIVEKYIYFGDGTRSASTDSIYKMYPVIGQYIPMLRVRDKNGFIVTDSTIVGVNN